jgi:acetyltransferase-like isoleucine patch superfamily enzyme
MAKGSIPDRPPRHVIAWRMATTMVSIVVEQGLVCALALTPVVVIWTYVTSWLPEFALLRAAVFSAMLVPSYIAFALCLMVLSGLATRATGTVTPADTEMRIAEMSWPLMCWARHMIRLHIVRVCAGTLFRGSPIWTAYLRMNGARIGRRVYVNTVHISDYNLLEFGDDVVIGSEVHISGHTVEAGVVKTGRVRLDRNVTIGLSSVIEIGVEIGPNSQIGALSFVPKHSKLPGGSVYAGIPVRRLDSRSS